MRLLVAILIFAQSLQASHIIGGNFKITQTGRNDFSIELIVFRDCGTIGNPVQLQKTLKVTFFDPISGQQVGRLDISKFDSLYVDLGDECHTPTGLCVQEIHLKADTVLPDHANGYLAVAQICCRNAAISNVSAPASTGISWTAKIPDPRLLFGNATPDLGSYPPSGYLCLDYMRELDLSATDADGDSLSYEIVPPLTETMPAPPFGTVTFRPGFTAQAPISGSPPFSLDPQTGVLRSKPDQLGIYVFAYQVSEYRKGIRIGSVRRDIQLQVLGCVIDQPPLIVKPLDTNYEVEAGKDFCIEILATDSNFTDTVFLSSELINQKGQLFSSPAPVNGFGQGSVNQTFCWIPLCQDAVSGQQLSIALTATSSGCNKKLKDTLTLNLHLPSLAAHLETLLPNVFTPNGDGVNDVYRLHNPIHEQCLQSLEIMIYNRWGIKIYESTLQTLTWDGTVNGKPATPGVYFFVVTGTYGGAPFNTQQFLTLLK